MESPRERTEDGQAQQGEKTRFWGALALEPCCCEEQRRRKHAPAANGSCSWQSSIGEQGWSGAQHTAICFELAPVPRSARKRQSQQRRPSFV